MNLNGIETWNDDELWIVREAMCFFLGIAQEREKDGFYEPGTYAQAVEVAEILGLDVTDR